MRELSQVPEKVRQSEPGTGRDSGSSGIAGWIASRPNYLFVVGAAVAYGSAAFLFARGSWILQPTQDIWQHVAALRELIREPFAPSNPFVVSDEGSRHFNPYWVSIALVARGLGWPEGQAIAAAGFLNAAVLVFGIHRFGAAYYRHPWGPLALLVAMVLGWSIPLGYTGFHSWTALAKGAAYPATLLVGMSLIAWALAIRSAEGNNRSLFLLTFLAALMFAIHQLGAVIGFVVIVAIAGLWPDVPRRRRIHIAAAVVVGTMLSALWPYHNPLLTMLHSGNSSWSSPNDFFTPYYLIAFVVPTGVGIGGLMRPIVPCTGRPFMAALALFVVAFLLNRAGLLIGERFIMPAMLLMQIGLGTLVIRWFSGSAGFNVLARIAAISAGLACVFAQATMTVVSAHYWNGLAARGETVQQEARGLCADIPDDVPVAAYGPAAWPVVASGQRVVSIPWPEPMIADLSERQNAVERIFEQRITREQRAAAAAAWGASTLILDERYVGRGRSSRELIRALSMQSNRVLHAGPMWRFDLAADAPALR